MDVELPASQLALLSGVRVGMWSSSRTHQGHWMLILPWKELFVVIVETWDPVDLGGGTSLKRFSTGTNALLRQLGAHSPFRSKIYKDRGCAFAFEVHFDCITGMDYMNHLIQPGRFVLEAKDVRKREFLSLRDAFDYYSGSRAMEATPASISALFGDCSSPQKRSSIEGTTGIGSDNRLIPPPAPSSPPLVPVHSEHRAKQNLLQRLGTTLSRNHSQAFEKNASSSSDGFLSQESPVTVSSRQLNTNDAFYTHEKLVLATSASKEPATMTADAHAAASTVRHLPPPPVRISSSSQEQNTEGDLPPTHAFTGTARVYDFRLITVYWTDPHLPVALRPVIEKRERMLKMYESGLPAWAIFFPTYGFYYRPWLRSFTWVTFYAFSFISLALGFWDLYKTLPGLQALLSRLVAGVWLPPVAVLQWFEEHAQIRLSLLLTYLFGKSELFVYVMRIVGSLTQSARTALEPIIVALGPTAVALKQIGYTTWTFSAGVLHSGIAPILNLLQWLSSGIVAVFFPLVHAAHAAVIVPATWILATIRQLNAAGSILWKGLVGAGQTVATGVLAAKATAKMGQTASSAVASTSPWLVWLAPADALEALRGSLMRAARSSQAVWKFIVHVCNGVVRHRMTLSRRAGRWWHRVKRRCGELIWIPIKWLLYVLQWVIVGLAMIGRTLAAEVRPKRRAIPGACDATTDKDDHSLPPIRHGGEDGGAGGGGGGGGARCDADNGIPTSDLGHLKAE